MAKGGRRSTSWKRGESGNLSGRPKRPATVEAHKIIADVKAAACELTPQRLGRYKEVMENKKAPPAARVTAATAILDRGWGKPKETLETTGQPAFVQLVERALMVVNKPPPAELGEVLTIEQFRAREAGEMAE